MHLSLNYQRDEENQKIYFFLNYRRNEDKPKYLFLNYERNKKKIIQSSLNYQRDEQKQIYLFLNYWRNEDEPKYLFSTMEETKTKRSIHSWTIDDLTLLDLPSSNSNTGVCPWHFFLHVLLYTALQMQIQGGWESNINVWFTLMYTQKWNYYFQNRIMMFCLPVPTLIHLWDIYIFP